MSTWGIVLAAGSGLRFGAPKQLLPLGERRVVDWAVAAATSHCDGVVLVVPEGDEARYATEGVTVVAGGPSRAASVRCGLSAVPAAASVVVVHDGARPVPAPDVWRRVLEAVASGADAAVPVVPVTDTLRSVDGTPIDRAGVVAVQTPQAFRAEVLRDAHAEAADGTDDASLVDAAGGRVVLVDGDPANIKITTPVDLAFARLLCG